MSLTIDNPLDAMIYFFLAVLLVIAGTYFLFISGSIFILKKLKKNKPFYYRPSPFISISRDALSDETKCSRVSQYHYFSNHGHCCGINDSSYFYWDRRYFDGSFTL